MPDVVKHAWTHRARSKGETDPLPQLPFAEAVRVGTAQVVTATTELAFEEVLTNSPGTFGWDEGGDPAGIEIKEPGFYGFFAAVRYASGSIAVVRTMYTTVTTVSDGPLSGVGFENGQFGFSAGSGQGLSSLGEVTASHGKSVLNHVSTGIIGSSPSYGRAAVILTRAGADYTVSGQYSGLVIVQFSTEAYSSLVSL